MLNTLQVNLRHIKDTVYIIITASGNYASTLYAIKALAVASDTVNGSSI